LLADPRQQQLIIRSTLNEKALGQVNRTVDSVRGVYTGAIRSKKTVMLGDLSQLQLEGDDRELLPKQGCFLSIPLQHKSQVLGLLNFVRAKDHAFSRQTVKLLTSVSQQAAMVILNAQLYQEKVDMSVTDELTKLANRRLLRTRLELEWNRARRYESPMSLLMVDIDHFKRYNDRNGHLLGDKVLQGVARILESNTRSIDTVARFGGEEFVVILPGQDKQTAQAVADKLRQAVSGGNFPRTDSQPAGNLTISVGIAAYPDDADDPQVLLNRCDLALYASKRGGRDRTVAFEVKLEQMAEEHRQALLAKKSSKRRRKRRPRIKGDA